MSAAPAAWALAAAGLALAALQWRARAAGRHGVRRACHELRGPITAARLGLQFGASRGELSAAGLRALDLELGRAGLALEELSGSRLVRASLARERVDVRGLLEDSVAAWHGSARVQGASLALRWAGPRGFVIGDRLRLGQVTGNLLANAIEHAGGVITVTGRVAAGSVRIELTDTGPGLPQAARAMLGGGREAPPAAGRARTARLRGRLGARCLARRRGPLHGHGLAVAEAVTRRHGGRLWAAETETGARIVVELPLAA